MSRFFLVLSFFFLFSCKKEDSQPGQGGGNPDTGGTPPPVPSGVMQYLPKRVAFGVKSDISQTGAIITETDYMYQYLTGDVFSDNWTNWNTPTGEYARLFMQRAGQLNKVPVFTYYMVVPGRNRYEDPAVTNLNDPAFMRKYFDNWKLLLDICKQYNKPVIIHYEPDMVGYMQIANANPTNSPVSVASSGHADASGFGNNAKGLFQTIKAMRDKYAPNALLGWHASQWATGTDLIVNHGNPEQLATQTANYYKSLQASFDLIFSEFSDRDAGYYEVVRGENRWWSTTANGSNGNLSDFDRFQRYLKQLNTETNQKIILWQIPIGNTLTKTCNNTKYHYKDNRPEYLLQPVLQNGSKTAIQHYANAGVIAFLFGIGHDDCTNYLDDPADGVTGSGEVMDNDGGYLRKGIKAYYTAGPIVVQ